MRRLHVIPSLLLAMLACTDIPTSLSHDLPMLPPHDTGARELVGTLVANNLLRTSDGAMVPLMGHQTYFFADLVGAQIRVRGLVDEIAAPDLWISDFRVLSVDGLPALDGMLVGTEEGFAIRTVEGAHMQLPAIPDDLRIHVGGRVWLTLRDGSFVRYGPLTE